MTHATDNARARRRRPGTGLRGVWVGDVRLGGVTALGVLG